MVAVIVPYSLTISPMRDSWSAFL